MTDVNMVVFRHIPCISVRKSNINCLLFPTFKNKVLWSSDLMSIWLKPIFHFSYIILYCGNFFCMILSLLLLWCSWNDNGLQYVSLWYVWSRKQPTSSSATFCSIHVLLIICNMTALERTQICINRFSFVGFPSFEKLFTWVVSQSPLI